MSSSYYYFLFIWRFYTFLWIQSENKYQRFIENKKYYPDYYFFRSEYCFFISMNLSLFSGIVFYFSFTSLLIIIFFCWLHDLKWKKFTWDEYHLHSLAIYAIYLIQTLRIWEFFVYKYFLSICRLIQSHLSVGLHRIRVKNNIFLFQSIDIF